MKRALVFLALIVAVPVGPARAESHVLALHAEYDAHPTPDALCRGARVVGDGTVAGEPTGAGSWHDEECADLVQDPGKISVRDGHLTLSTPDGTILATYTASGDLPDENLDIELTGSFVIVGGTGLYADASGSGSIVASANLIDPATIADLNGTISY